MPSFIYTPIIAEAHTPPYKIHKYFARRPHNVFSQLVENFTSPNDIILDPFCGGGVTIYEGLIKNRRVIGCDLNPLSIFIVRNMIKKFEDFSFIEDTCNELSQYIETLTKDYLYFIEDGQRYDLSWAEMTMTVRCPECGRITPLSNSLKIRNGKYRCSNNFCSLNSAGELDIVSCERTGPQYLFLVSVQKRIRKVKRFEKEDVLIYNNHIQYLKSEMIKNKLSIPRDTIPMDWDRQFEDGL